MAEYRDSLCFDCDIEQAALQGEAEQVRNYTDLLRSKLQQLVSERLLDELHKTVLAESRKLAWIVQKYTAEQDMGFLIGVCAGALSCLEEYLRQQHQTERAGEFAGELKAASLPHARQILFTIEAHEGIRHGQLAEQIGIEKSTLSGIMDKLVASGAVVFSRPGKFKYYFLSQMGKRYCDQNRGQYEASKDFDTLMEQMLELIDQDKAPSELVGRIVRTIYDRKKEGAAAQPVTTRHEELTELVKRLNAAKPSVSLEDDPSNSVYRVEEAYSIQYIFDKEERLVLKTNEISQRQNAAARSNLEGVS